MIINHNGCIMEGTFLGLPLQNGGNDDNVVFFGQGLEELCRLSIIRFSKFDPWISFPCTHEERSSPYFLQCDNICTFKHRYLYYFLNSFHKRMLLFLNRFTGGKDDFVLNCCNSHSSRISIFFVFSIYPKMFYLNISTVCPFDCFLVQSYFISFNSVKDLPDVFKDLWRKISSESFICINKMTFFVVMFVFIDL